MPLTAKGEISPIKGLRGAFGYSRRTYVTTRNVRPRRRPFRKAPVGEDPQEMRAAPGIEGSLLERIVFKRLELLVGPVNIGFIYKYQIGAIAGVDARAFIGGVEADFVIINRPSQKQMALEILGANWHGPKDQYADQDRALTLIGAGLDYAEIEEYEINLGDAYLDHRLEELIGVSRFSVRENTDERELRTVQELRPLD